MNKQHNPHTELPPHDMDTEDYSIPVLIQDGRGHCVARYHFGGEFWFVDDGYIPSQDNSGVADVYCWWYLPEYIPE